MLNTITIMGRLTADPELKTTNSGAYVCSFTVAVDRNFQSVGEDKQTDFIDVVAWRSTAEFVSRYFTKGRMIIVQGSLQSRKWQDKDGNKRVSWEVQAERVYFGDSKTDDTASREPVRREGSNDVQTTPPSSDESFTPLPEEDLPF